MSQISRTEGQKLINKSMKNASVRLSRLLESFSIEGSSRSGVVDVGSEDAEGENDSDEAEEENKPDVDCLYTLYYKKFQNKAFDEEDAFLADVMNKKSCIQEKLFSPASKLLLKKDLNIREEIMLKYDYFSKRLEILAKSIVTPC
ncbi:MAG: hypothetical protein EXX96DRAFT_159821 [Benjaminiella poitrasii]|nr:MAG: hypothetical protein EXX96DRAFT_159821 [Benjaminiella poitrasii]